MLKKHKVVSKDSDLTVRLKQITLENTDFDALELISKIKSINPTEIENIKIVESTHSIDILSKDVSKLNLVEHVKKNILKQYKIMCIGDKGKLPGKRF